jgi:hypothetical protein
MTKASTACAALLFVATPAAAQRVVTPFDPKRTHGSPGDPVLMSAADGKILMRLIGTSAEESPRTWSSLYVS